MATIETKDNVKADLALMGSLKSEKDRNAAIDKFEIGASDSTLNRRIAVYMWGVGKASGGNEPAPIDGYLKTINSKMRGGSTGRTILSDKSVGTYNSYYANFAALGFVKGWDTTSVLVWILDNVKGKYSTRGAFMKDVYSLTEEPSEEKLATMWKASQDAPKLDGKASAIVKAGTALAKEPAFKQTLLGNANVKTAYQKMVLAMNAFEAAVKATGGSASDDDDDFLKEIMADAA